MREVMDVTDAEIGDAATVAIEGQAFRRNAALLSNRPSLIDSYDGEWIAVIGGDVQAKASTYDGIFAVMRAAGIDPRYAVVRHIQRNQRTLII